MTERVVSICDQCGPPGDVHPKAHLGDVTKHHDCLSYAEKQQLIESGQEKGAPKVSAIIAACEGGTRGDALLDLILSGDLPKATGKGGRTDV